MQINTLISQRKFEIEINRNDYYTYKICCHFLFTTSRYTFPQFDFLLLNSKGPHNIYELYETGACATGHYFFLLKKWDNSHFYALIVMPRYGQACLGIHSLQQKLVDMNRHKQRFKDIFRNS